MQDLDRVTTSRKQQLATLATLADQQWDIIIVGGGITGAGTLLMACKAGLKALLVEQQDFAWGASSNSSKMVHGGLRYLGSGQYGLTKAMQTQAAGKASAYSYVQIVFSALLGVWIFNEIPSVWTYLGGGLIVTGALINVFGKQLLVPFRAK